MEHQDSSATIFAVLTNHLENSDHEEIWNIVNGESLNSDLIENSWDIVPKVCSYLTENNEDNNQFIKACEALFSKLCQIGNTKELLLVFLEQLDGVISDVKLLCLLQPIQTCLLSLPAKRGHSISISLETLYGYIAQLPIPDLNQLEDEERKLLDLDSDVRKILHVVSEILFFLKPFAQDTSSSASQKREITLFMIKILDHPLGHLDIIKRISDDSFVKSNSHCRDIAEKLLSQLTYLEKDFSKVIGDCLILNKRIEYSRKHCTVENKEVDDDHEDFSFKEPVPELGLAVYAFLILSDTTNNYHIPKVFTYLHWLDLTSKLIFTLLNHNNVLIKEKGVVLLRKILDGTHTISSDVLHWDEYKKLIDSVVIIMCGSQSKYLAQISLKAYGELYGKCELDRKFQFLYYIFTKSSHSGLLGYTITLLKDDINKNLNSDVEDRNSVFKAPRLLKLLEIVFSLPDDEKTDMLENIDRIMSALNLLRYLTMRDKVTDNVSGVWTIKKHINTKFIETIRLGINISRAHYNLDIEKVKSGKKSSLDDDVDFTVSGQTTVPAMSKEQKLQVLEMALFRFDMIESILVRVGEIIEQTEKHPTEVTK